MSYEQSGDKALGQVFELAMVVWGGVSYGRVVASRCDGCVPRTDRKDIMGYRG